VSDHLLLIQKNEANITSHDSEFQNLKTIIEGLKNADNVLTNSLNDNALRFHVETKQDGSVWPLNTLITYETKLTDTHNTMNTKKGIFIAPFSGFYGFVFYAKIQCVYNIRAMFVDHNGARSEIFHCDFSTSTTSNKKSSSIYFALSLKQGDTVGIFAGTAYVSLGYHPAKFTGFLLQKN
jgi:hypothetical protein